MAIFIFISLKLTQTKAILTLIARELFHEIYTDIKFAYPCDTYNYRKEKKKKLNLKWLSLTSFAQSNIFYDMTNVTLFYGLVFHFYRELLKDFRLSN